jgi:hypothetical protein
MYDIRYSRHPKQRTSGPEQERREPVQHPDQAFPVSKASKNKGGQLSILVSQSEGNSGLVGFLFC